MLVICGKRGQLGNRLFPFANMIALAIDRGMAVANPGFEEYAESFVGTSTGTVPRFPAAAGTSRRWLRRLAYRAGSAGLRVDRHLECVPWVALDDDESFDFEDASREADVERLLGSRLGLLDGLYLLARAHLVRNASLVREYFAPAATVAAEAARCLDRARAGGVLLVGIHIRQGDYRTQKPELYRPTVDYLGLMQGLERTFANRRLRFLVCSDSPQDAAAFGSLPVSFAPGRPAEDLFALAGCDYIAGPPSTFSQWASFHGRVPRYEWAPQLPGHASASVAPPAPEEFRVHQWGYGRFALAPETP